jgi:hypothetical protein
VAHLAFAIDGFVDLWGLEGPQDVDAGLAQSMFGALGSDVLIYRIGETQGSYFGVARLLSISAAPRTDRREVRFDRIRIFTAQLPYATGTTVLTRLQFLDDDEFAAVVSSGVPSDVGRQVAEKEQSYEPPASGESEMLALDADGADVCAFTGERLTSPGAWTTISTYNNGSGSAHNVLALSPAARQAFLAGHFSARADLSILVDMAAIDQALLLTMNSLGRLIVPENPTLQPSPENLAAHQRFVFLGEERGDRQSDYKASDPGEGSSNR